MTDFPHRCGFSKQFEGGDFQVIYDPELGVWLYAPGEDDATKGPRMTDEELREAYGDEDDDDWIGRWRRDDSTGEWIYEEGTRAWFKKNDDPGWPLSRARPRDPDPT